MLGLSTLFLAPAEPHLTQAAPTNPAPAPAPAPATTTTVTAPTANVTATTNTGNAGDTIATKGATTTSINYTIDAAQITVRTATIRDPLNIVCI